MRKRAVPCRHTFSVGAMLRGCMGWCRLQLHDPVVVMPQDILRPHVGWYPTVGGCCTSCRGSSLEQTQQHWYTAAHTA